MRHANKTEYATESGRETSMNFESRNPATGELLAVHPEHDKAETEARLQRAWDGWRCWSRTPLQERIAFVTRLAAAGGLHFRDQEIRLGRPSPRRSGGGLSQATARPRHTGADHL